MKQVTIYTTFDGKEHHSQKLAETYLKEMYRQTRNRATEAMMKAVHGVEPYKKIDVLNQWVDDNLPALELLVKIQRDLKVEKP